MTTAATEPFSVPDVLSPELVLVDPRLAERARALLRECRDESAEEARRRLLEVVVDSDVVDGDLTSVERFRRLTMLVATSSAAAAGAVAVLQAVSGLS